MSVYIQYLKVLTCFPLVIALFFTTKASANTFIIPDNITIHTEKAWEVHAIRMSNPEFQLDFEKRMANAIADNWGEYLDMFASVNKYPYSDQRQERIDFLNSIRHSHFGSTEIPYPDLDIEKHDIRGVNNFSAETTTENYWTANNDEFGNIQQFEPYEILPDYAVVVPCYPGSIVSCPKDHEGYEVWKEYLEGVEAGEFKTAADLIVAQAELNGVELNPEALSLHQGIPLSEEFLDRHELHPENDIHSGNNDKANTPDLTDIRAPLAAAAVEDIAELTEWSGLLLASEHTDFPTRQSNVSFAASSTDPIATPEPMTMSLLASGLLGAALRKRKLQT